MGSGRPSILRWAPAGMRRRRRSRHRGGIERHPSQTLNRRRLRRLRRPRPRTLVALVALILLLGGVWLWVRDSSLVAVHKVRVTGASGPDAAEIRSALAAAAHNMTTLDVNMKQLRTAVAPYPVVKRLDVTTQFPHGMRIRVIEQVPVAILDAGGRQTAVAGDGTLLHDATAKSTLPTISLQVVPGGTKLTGYALTEVRLLAAAPYPLLAKIDTVSDGAAHGLVAKLRNGPSIYFGDSTQLATKWTAAAQVLADSRSAGAAYIDVTDPSRPAAGAGGDVNGSNAPAGDGAATTASQDGAAAASPSDQAAAGASATATPSSSSAGG
jgi:cell division protein FtsQ